MPLAPNSNPFPLYPKELWDLHTLDKDLSRLRECTRKLLKSPENKINFALTQDVCMRSRTVASEYLSHWLKNHAPPRPGDQDAVENALDQAIQGVKRFRHLSRIKGTREENHAKLYLRNESIRLSRVRALRNGLSAFHDLIERRITDSKSRKNSFVGDSPQRRMNIPAKSRQGRVMASPHRPHKLPETNHV